MSQQSFSAPESPSASAPAAGASTTAAKAGFWIRFLASFIDGIILGVISVPLELGLKGAGYAIAIVLSIVYYTYCEGSERGQTVGKAACSLRVIGTDGAPIGYTRAFLRDLGRYISGIVILLGYLWMLWDPNKQTWHDKIGNAYVVRTKQV